MFEFKIHWHTYIITSQPKLIKTYNITITNNYDYNCTWHAGSAFCNFNWSTENWKQAKIKVNQAIEK